MFLLRNYINQTKRSYYSFCNAKIRKQKSLYQILEVPPNATQTTIKKHYLKLAKIYHPDIYKGADKNRFQKIQQAYKILSNQSNRSTYDETIGLKSNTRSEYEDSSQKYTEGTYGKAKNDFNYTKPTVQINIDEEYEKFFKKKSTTNFQEIRLHQQTEFKNMSENQRVRRRFTQIYPDQNKRWKMQYSKSYSQILQDQINQKNIYEQEQKKKKEQHERKFNEEGIKYRKRVIIIGSGVVFLLMIPFIFSYKTKLRLQRQAKQSYQKKIAELFSQMQNTQIRQRINF